MSKIEKLEKLYKSYTEAYLNEEFVPGYGNVDSDIILIGEAPGRDEVRLGQPFVGMAGKNLAIILDKLHLTRNDIYTTNAIKYRLTKISEKSGGKINRPATIKEIETSLSTLLEEIDIIDPSYIITLGNVPLRTLTLDAFRPIGEVHGDILKITILNKTYNLIPLYHPASIIYNHSLEEIYDKDIQRVKFAFGFNK